MSEYESGRSYDPAKDASAQEPLTANEQKLVTRLFGDPFAFPMEFKAWLRGWLEEQFPRIGSLAISAETGAAGAFVPPAGSILDYGGDTAPNGYRLCDGAEYDKTSLVYQRLFEAIGYKFGTGSTGNMFRVPDLQGRMTVGRGTHADVDSVGENEGAAVGSRRPKHRHTVGISDPGHRHDVNRVDAPEELNYGATNWYRTWAVGTVNDGSTPPDHGGHADPFNIAPAGTGISVSVGNAADVTDAAPYLVVNKIISLGA